MANTLIAIAKMAELERIRLEQVYDNLDDIASKLMHCADELEHLQEQQPDVIKINVTIKTCAAMLEEQGEQIARVNHVNDAIQFLAEEEE